MAKRRELGETIPANPANPRPAFSRSGGDPVKLRERLVRDSAKARADEAAETARLMTNWARWKSGASITVAISGAYDLEAQGRREATSIPLLNGEASDVDHAVEALPPELSQVVIEHWLKKGTAERHAKACRCSIDTYYNRLKHAHERVRAIMRAKQAQAERARELYRNRNKPSP